MPVRTLPCRRLLELWPRSLSLARPLTTLPEHQLECNISSSSSDLPSNVTSRLKSLPADVLAFLLDGKHGDSEPGALKGVHDMARHYFQRSGKLIRPSVTLLMANICNHQAKEAGSKVNAEGVHNNQYRIAMVAEMIHTASLIHDDVIDEAGTRRGRPTANVTWGNKRAVLGGDRILARATKLLCLTRDPDVITTMASIVDNLVDGEFMQLEVDPEADAISRFQHYMQKTYYKTASLFANSCLSVAILSGCPRDTQQKAYEFGRNFGLAFQLVDDTLDYVSSSAELGKPSVADLRQGLATGPVLFAAQEAPELNLLINRRFAEDGDVERAHRIVLASNALSQTRDLISRHNSAAVRLVQGLGQCGSVQALLKITEAQAHRER